MIIGLERGRDWMQGVARKGIPGRGNSIRKSWTGNSGEARGLE